MCSEILDMVAKYGIAPGKLAIEITEELLLDHNEQVHDQLATLAGRRYRHFD